MNIQHGDRARPFRTASQLWLLCLLVSPLLWVDWGMPPQSAVGTPADARILHILNRLSFGPRPQEIETIQGIGIDTYIKQQLNPVSIDLPPVLKQKLELLKTLTTNPIRLFQQFNPNQPHNKAQRRQPIQEALQSRLLRAVLSPRQLQEVMVDFWFNHFNVFVGKGATYVWIGAYEEQAIRPLALGHFRDLLGATARHPAMLYYLDNWQNTAPNSPGARGRFQGLNENYARELLELHTLGVDGGYNSQDVQELARIFTGFGLAQPKRLGDGSGFLFDPSRHDFGDKVFLGTLIPGQGEAEIEQVLDLLANHPATARHISTKLAQYFVADEPPESLVRRLSQRFSETEGDIRAVLETLFTSEEFWEPQYVGTKFKPPYQYIISLLRAVGSTNPDVIKIAGVLDQLSMMPYRCPTPDGYPNTEADWLNPDAMMRRVTFATAIAKGAWSGKSLIDAEQLYQTLGQSFSPKTVSLVTASPEEIQSALLLGSPEMMYH